MLYKPPPCAPFCITTSSMRAFTSHNFGASSADVILLTTAEDGVVSKFHLHKNVLSQASTFFETLFSLQQPKSHGKGLPVVPLPEPAHILDKLLRFVYHPIMQHPPISSLDDLTLLLAVATKYELRPAIDALRAELISPCYLSEDPLRVYAIAQRFDLDEEAVVASAWTLDMELLGGEDNGNTPPALPHPSLRYMTAYDFYQLLVLHQRRSKAARALLVVPDDIKCMQCNSSVFTRDAPPKWWTEWVSSAKEEMGKKVVSERLFGVDYLFEVARRTGCAGCTESVLHSWTFLMELKGRIDELPTTI